MTVDPHQRPPSAGLNKKKVTEAGPPVTFHKELEDRCIDAEGHLVAFSVGPLGARVIASWGQEYELCLECGDTWTERSEA